MSDLPGADAILSAVLQKADMLRAALAEKVDMNLSGNVLQMRSGTLRNSIVSSVEGDGQAVSISIGSVGVPYAAIQEYGGRTGAHDIVATKAKALRFVGANGVAFAKIVHHPGSLIPARSYIGSAIADMKDEIQDSLKSAILDALGAN
jgi:phage gpG-like protein